MQNVQRSKKGDKTDVLISTDIGSDVDDLFALLFSFKRKEISIRGISTSGGYALLRTMIIEKILRMTNKNIPICEGENFSLEGKKFWKSGLEKNYLEGRVIKLKNTSKNFVSFFEEISQNKPITILAWAPLTNIAKLLLTLQNPSSKIKKIIWMGGALSWSKEHNLNSDTKSAEIVFNSIVPLRIIPKELTHQFFIERKELLELTKINNSETLKFLIKRFDEWLRFVEENKGEFSFEFPPNATFIHDYLTVASLIKPELFIFQKMKLKIQDERILEDKKGKLVEVCIGFKDKEKVKKLLFDTLASL